MEIEPKKLYVGCGLTFASDEFVKQVTATKEALNRDWDVLEFLGTTAGTAADVYRVDIIENVGNCDAFIGILDEPSFGLGYETREALRLSKPTLLLAHQDSKITRLALGIPDFEDATVERYSDMTQDTPQIARQVFASLLEPHFDRTQYYLA